MTFSMTTITAPRKSQADFSIAFHSLHLPSCGDMPYYVLMVSMVTWLSSPLQKDHHCWPNVSLFHPSHNFSWSIASVQSQCSNTRPPLNVLVSRKPRLFTNTPRKASRRNKDRFMVHCVTLIVALATHFAEDDFALIRCLKSKQFITTQQQIMQ